MTIPAIGLGGVPANAIAVSINITSTNATGCAIVTGFAAGSPAGNVFEQINPDNSAWYLHHDQLGSSRAITNSAGATIATPVPDGCQRFAVTSDHGRRP